MRKLGLLFLLGNVVWFAACGGNGGGNNNSSTVTSVQVSCTPATITYSQTSQCSATVSGTGNFSTTVTWTASTGSISSSGLYTPPSPMNASIQATVTATSTQNTSVSGAATITVNPVTVSNNNVAPIIVDAGPTNNEVNLAYVTVTVCAHGTTNCQNIDHVQVDTGSEGLRLISGVLNASLVSGLSQETIGGNPVDECLLFADGYVWGPVYTADVTLGGETASNAQVHVLIPQTSSPPVPNSCSSQNPSGGNGDEGGSVSSLGANGILGVGPFQTDCGGYCVADGAGCGSSNQPCVYYTCSGSSCSGVNVPEAQQVPNPVILFQTDNNGVLVQLPSVPNGGSLNPTGSLIFGIGTQSNNGLGSANIYPIPNSGNNAGNFITMFNGQSYNQSFIDSGSNGLFFLSSSVNGVPATCTGQNSSWYCPNPSPDNLTASNQGENSAGQGVGTAVPVNFTIESANSLFNTSNTAFSTLGGPNPGAFDWGLPFFFGRNMFTAINGLSTPGGTGPYFAY